MAASTAPKVLIYLLRRDLRLSDNPIFHELCRLYRSQSPAFNLVLPIYIFPAYQTEISGFIPDAEDPDATPKSPYPEARSQVAGFWRCGPHRAKFLAESVWNVKERLGQAGSDLLVRVGRPADIIRDALDHFEAAPESSSGKSPADEGHGEVVGVWMTGEEGIEEKQEEMDIQSIVEERGKEFRIFQDEKYFVDDRDLPFQSIDDLSDIYTTFRKSLEPLRSRPRRPLPLTVSLPPFPEESLLPAQSQPFVIPNSLDGLISALLKPIDPTMGLPQPPQWPGAGSTSTPETQSAHPFHGGETAAQGRVNHLITSGAMSAYKDTRNGLLGPDFSTKLSAWLALGCITARQIHANMALFEDGNFDPTSSGLSAAENEECLEKLAQWKDTEGFGKGENNGTGSVRFELLWRDYFRLVARKYGNKLFHLHGLRGSREKKWKGVGPTEGTSGDEMDITDAVLQRFCSGRTGISLIDASQRELFLTGYSSNRARQNVASFLAKHLNVDWRLGAEWYECMLVDYDVANNWGNWQYVAGVGNDPREGRLFNPVKQALDYDSKGQYIKAWVSELRGVDLGPQKEGDGFDDERLMGLFQPWRLPEAEKQRLDLKGLDFVEDPLVKIPFSVGKNPRPSGKRSRGRGGGPSRGPRGGPGRGGPYRGRGGRGGGRTSDVERAGAMEQSR